MTIKDIFDGFYHGKISEERALIEVLEIYTKIDIQLKQDTKTDLQKESYSTAYGFNLFPEGITLQDYWEQPLNPVILEKLNDYLKKAGRDIEEIVQLLRMKEDVEECIAKSRGIKTAKHIKAESDSGYEKRKCASEETMKGLSHQVNKLLDVDENLEQKQADQQNIDKTDCIPQKIIWKWSKADLAWLYQTLIQYGALDCNSTTFSSVFLDKDMQPMPSALLDYVKGRSPKKQGMQDIRQGISHHISQVDRS